jgi:hypothetical protein
VPEGINGVLNVAAGAGWYMILPNLHNMKVMIAGRLPVQYHPDILLTV